MTKKLNIKTLVRLQKKYSAIYKTTPLCGIEPYGVHIQGLDNLRALAPGGCELVTAPRDDIGCPYETHFVYDGVRFFAIHRGEND